MNNLDYYRIIFADLELSDKIEDARKEATKHLVNEGYIVRTREPIAGSKNHYDLVCYDPVNRFRIAVVIGRHSARKLRLKELNIFNGDKVYLLRGNARITAEEREGINIISVMSKGSL